MTEYRGLDEEVTSDETLKPIGSFYLMSMPLYVKYPTQAVIDNLSVAQYQEQETTEINKSLPT